MTENERSINDKSFDSIVIELGAVFRMLKAVRNFLAMYYDRETTHKQLEAAIKQMRSAEENCLKLIGDEDEKR